MADISKRGSDCDDDCEGERGEHGERGKRGKRGPELFVGFPVPDSLDVRVTLGGSISADIPVSATIGVE